MSVHVGFVMTEWHWNRSLFEHLSLPLLLLFYQCCVSHWFTSTVKYLLNRTWTERECVFSGNLQYEKLCEKHYKITFNEW